VIKSPNDEKIGDRAKGRAGKDVGLVGSKRGREGTFCVFELRSDDFRRAHP